MALKNFLRLQATLRMIEDHRAMVDDLVSTGQELTELCSPDEKQAVSDDVDYVTEKYDTVKRAVRDKLHQLNATLRGSNTDVSFFGISFYRSTKLMRV